MHKTRHPNVYLSLAHLDPEKVRARFPGIAAMCAEFSLDLARDRIPVRPGAHYMIGGVTVDLEGRTTLPGLLAAGEVTSTGLHGANRLASNSLLEGLVYGAHAGAVASATALTMKDTFTGLPLENKPLPQPHEQLDLLDIRNSLRSLMWRAAGVERDAATLQEAAEDIAGWRRYVLARQFTSPAGWELQNMLLLARLMIAAALERQESRGVHLRTDYPQSDSEHWLRHVSFAQPEN
jgi:L-aspartate oxidase